MALAQHRRLLCTPLPSLLSSSSSSASALRLGPRPLALRVSGSSCPRPLHTPVPRVAAPRLLHYHSVPPKATSDSAASVAPDDDDTNSHEPPSLPFSRASPIPRQQTNYPRRSKLRDQPQDTNNADKRKYLLDVMAIYNQGRRTTVPAESINTAGQEEVPVFEEWESMKLQEEGSSAEPVIQEMRTSLTQRLTNAPPPELWPARSPSLELPTEKDPLAAVAVRPVVVKRRTKVPEDWDGPGGTVVLIDKPQGDVEEISMLRVLETYDGSSLDSGWQGFKVTEHHRFDGLAGWSSFAVCGRLRYMLGVKKVGHAGTLDPLSTGLLIVCVGKATKLADSYQAMTKVYSGTMRIGETTPSLDADTPVSEKLPWEHIQEQDMRNAVDKSFLGDLLQVPPMYSAIKVKGERLYMKARRGEEIVVPPRTVKVYDFQLKRSSQNKQEWDFYIVCSKGTYIRSLCADVALSLGSCAYLTALRREKIGSLSAQDAWPIEELERCYSEVLKAPF